VRTGATSYSDRVHWHCAGRAQRQPDQPAAVGFSSYAVGGWCDRQCRSAGGISGRGARWTGYTQTGHQSGLGLWRPHRARRRGSRSGIRASTG
jgi:hypothetical protein